MPRPDSRTSPRSTRRIQFETVDAMRVVDDRIVEHWGVAKLYSLVQQLST